MGRNEHLAPATDRDVRRAYAECTAAYGFLDTQKADHAALAGITEAMRRAFHLLASNRPDAAAQLSDIAGTLAAHPLYNPPSDAALRIGHRARGILAGTPDLEEAA